MMKTAAVAAVAVTIATAAMTTIAVAVAAVAIKKSADRLAPGDRILFLLAVAAAVISGIFIYGAESGSAEIVIDAPGGRWIYPLNEDRTVDVAGSNGTTVVVVSGGTVRIADSPCPNRTCIARGEIAAAGQVLVCLPNAVCITLRGTPPDGFDAVNY